MPVPTERLDRQCTHPSAPCSTVCPLCTLPEGSRAGCDQWQWGVGQLRQGGISEAKASDIYIVRSSVTSLGVPINLGRTRQPPLSMSRLLA